MTEKSNHSENSKKELIEAIEFWRDRVIHSCGLPPKIVIISTQYNIASGASETEQITWSREVSNYGVHYNPETIENWRGLSDCVVEFPQEIEFSQEELDDYATYTHTHLLPSHTTEYSEQQVQDMRNSFVESLDRYQAEHSSSLIRNVKTSCRNYDKNPYLQCAIDPNLNCDRCPHYEYLDPTK